jgi:guanylate kinase
MRPIFAFIGPSGSGKTTLMLELLARMPDDLGIIRSVTSRAQRNADDAKWYRFLTRDEILGMRDRGELIQYLDYAGNLYGMARKDADDVLQTKCGIQAFVEDAVKQFTDAGYRMIVIRVVPQGAWSPNAKDRVQADAERAKTRIPIDLEITNSFDDGGKEKAIEQLENFILQKTSDPRGTHGWHRASRA